MQSRLDRLLAVCVLCVLAPLLVAFLDFDHDLLDDPVEAQYGMSTNGYSLPDLRAWYQLDQTNAVQALDRTTNQAHLILQGGAKFITNGLFYEAMDFDGKGDALKAPDSPVFDLESFTFSAWVKTTNLPKKKDQTLARWKAKKAKPEEEEDEDGGKGGWQIGTDSDGRLEARFDTKEAKKQFVRSNPPSTNFVADGFWHHVALVYSRASNLARIYVDGEFEAEKTIEGRFHTDMHDFRIGHKGWGKYWKGQIDEIRLYARDLGSDEIPLLPSTFADPDQDGLNNLGEFQKGTDPFDPDTDDDGIGDLEDPEINPPDSDGDGMLDTWEVEHGFDPNNPNDGGQDADGDGLTNLQEFQAGTDPRNSDTDGDGLPDQWEVTNGTNPTQNDANADLDGDGVSNLNEFQQGRNPNAGVVPDTNNVVSLKVFPPLE